jgi:hypothetical protein
MQEYVKRLKPQSVTRRFIVDCHNGKDYWNNEFDHIAVDGTPESDAVILKHLREQCLAFDGNKMYSCIEVTGSSVTALQLRGEQPMTDKDEVDLSKHMRVVFFQPWLEPLSSYPIMI